MSESGLWQVTKDQLSPFGRVLRIENRVWSGTPDVAYCLRHHARAAPGSGWIELKELPGWPIRELTPVVIDHLRVEQVQFLEEWAAAGGRAWLLLRVLREYLLLSPRTVREVYDRRLTRGALFAAATVRSRKGFPSRGLLEALTI